jgi:hypothetical protein
MARRDIKHRAQIIDQRLAFLLTGSASHIGRLAADLGLDSVKGADPLEDVGGQRRGGPHC